MKNIMFKSLNKAISTPIAIIIVIVVAVLAIGGVLAYQYLWAPKEKIEIPEVKVPEKIETPKEIIDLINKFETHQKERSAEKVLNLFTQPQTEAEKKDYDMLFMDGMYRLYSANELTFLVKSWSIEKLTKISDKEYQIQVSEIRDTWSQVIGGWSGKSTELTLTFLVVKQNNQWLIDKYSYQNTTDKYSGFSNLGKLR